VYYLKKSDCSEAVGKLRFLVYIKSLSCAGNNVNFAVIETNLDSVRNLDFLNFYDVAPFMFV